MILLLLAAELVGMQPAGNTVEVEIDAVGTADVPAQAYQIYAMIPQMGPGAPQGRDGSRKLLAQLSALEEPARETCTPPSPFGFVGNEAYDDTYDEESPAEDTASDEVPLLEEERSPVFNPPIVYSGTFVSRERAEQAIKLVRAGQAGLQRVTPVLYECSEAMQLAKIDALKRSQEEVVSTAKALGMQVVGVTKIADDGNLTSVESALASLYSANRRGDQVKVTRTLKVTYLLRK